MKNLRFIVFSLSVVVFYRIISVYTFLYFHFSQFIFF